MAYVIACEYLLSFLLRQKRTDQDVLYFTHLRRYARTHTRMYVDAIDTHTIERYEDEAAKWRSISLGSHRIRMSETNARARYTQMWQFLVANCDCIHKHKHIVRGSFVANTLLPLLPGCYRCPYACCTHIAVTPLTTTKKWNIFIMQSRNNKVRETYENKNVRSEYEYECER